jgi:predicted metal-dependent hydrolase
VSQTIVTKEKSVNQQRPMKARRMRTRGLEVEQRHWLRGEAYPTAFFNALSAVFPVGEAFMIECLRPWQKNVPEDLAADVKTFIEQEAAHSREHAGMNRALIRAGYDIAPLDKVIRGFVNFFADSSDITKLGATMCIEHLTAIVAAELLANPRHMAGAEPDLHKLWLWHSIEEVEHKAVAFDVWMYATRDWSALRRWATRSAMMVGVSASFFFNRTRGQVELMRQDGEHWSKALPGLIRFGFGRGGIGRAVLRPWVKFLKPGFHPWQIDDHALITKGEAMVAAMSPASGAEASAVVRPALVAKAA